MKNARFSIFINIAATFTVTAFANAQPELIGYWEGAVTRKGAVQLVAVQFDMQQGRLTGRISIPELGMFDEPITELSYKAPKLAFHIVYGRFQATVHAEIGEITGGNPKWGPPVGLHLKRAPEPPCVFTSEPIRFHNGELTLAGSLLLPATPGPHAAMVFIHGSGPCDRDSWVYRSAPTVLARLGVAALIYDKRGTKESSGNYETATFEDLVGDSLAAVDYLKTRPDIQKDRIGLFGASQGGWLAPMAAVKRSDIAFVVMHAGAAVSVWRQERDSVKYRMKSEGFAAQQIEDALHLVDQIFDVVRTGSGWDKLASAIKDARPKKWASFVQLPSSSEDAMEWRLQEYDPAETLRHLKCPVLALFGGSDDLVPPQENVDKLRAYLRDAGNNDVTIKVFPHADHNIETRGSLVGNRWDWPDGFWVWPRRAPGYFETLTDWVLSHTQKGR